MREDAVDILLVDDSPAKLLALEAALTPLGERIQRASSGREALRLLLTHDFAVILLDAAMPVMDGFETAQLIRGRERSADTPIIFVSAVRVADDDLLRGYGHGAVDYMPVPIVPAVLRAKVAVFVDLHRKRQELARLNQQLDRLHREARTMLAAIVESSPDAIVSKTLDGIITSWNAGAERSYGWAAQEAIGQPLAIIVPDELRGEMEETLEKVRGGDAVEQVETVRLRKNGERLQVSLSVSPICDESGAVVGIASIGRDVTELKRAREDLRLQRDALAAANAELARSNADLDQFAAVVSHDLKAPLRGISSLAEWLAEDHGDALGEHGREQLALVESRAQRMYRLIDGILEYSRAGRSRKFESVDSKATMLDILDALAPPGGIEVQLGAQLPTVVYDEAQLTQVLQNLVDNAIKHLGRATGVVRVDARERGDAWEFCVTDDGVGIPEEHRERIFRIYQTLSQKSGSTGVGLAVVKKIVEANGGRVWVAQPSGIGSEFCFTVPKRRA